MQYKELYYLLSLGEEIQISQAAKKLNINQSSLSLYLQRIEDRVGTKLYNRNLKCLTPAGKIYSSGASKILTLHDKAIEDIKKLFDINSVEIAVDINIGLRFHNVFLNAIQEFNQKYPDIVIHQHYLAENQIIEQLLHEKLDLAYCYLSETTSILERQTVSTEKLVLIHSKTAEFEGRPVNELFENIEYIAMFKNSHIRTVTETALFKHNIVPRLTVESDSYDLTHALMEHGRYITIVPAMMANMFSEYNYHLLDPIISVKSGFMLHPNNSGLPHITYLMELIQLQMKRMYRSSDNQLFIKDRQK